MGYKTKLSSSLTVIVSVALGVVINLICCALIAIMAGKGIVSEESFQLYAVIVQSVSTATVVVLAWFLAPDDKAMYSAICAGALLAVQIVLGLLFGEIGWRRVLVCASVVAVVCFVVTFMLSRQKKSAWICKKKKWFC